MEIIPILSTIILVATIATFILAVAAYILYKIRERRARAGGGRAVQVVTPTLAPQHTLVAPTTMLALPPAYGAGVPMGAQGYGSPALNAPPLYPGLDSGYGGQGLPPMALDTNADGRPDTIYEPRPTQRDAYGQPTAYQPSNESPYGMREMEAMPYTPPGMRSAPGYPTPGYPDYGDADRFGASSGPSFGGAPYGAPTYDAPSPYGAPPPFAAQTYAAVPAPPPPPPQSGGLFFELTGQGLTPVGGSAQPALPAPPDATGRALAAEQSRQAAIDQEQARLAAADEESRAREDALRQQQRRSESRPSDDSGMAWY